MIFTQNQSLNGENFIFSHNNVVSRPCKFHKSKKHHSNYSHFIFQPRSMLLKHSGGNEKISTKSLFLYWRPHFGPCGENRLFFLISQKCFKIAFSGRKWVWKAYLWVESLCEVTFAKNAFFTIFAHFLASKA